jgi:hypothetical protein
LFAILFFPETIVGLNMPLDVSPYIQYSACIVESAGQQVQCQRTMTARQGRDLQLVPTQKKVDTPLTARSLPV